VVDMPACRSCLISLRCRFTRFRIRSISPLMRRSACLNSRITLRAAAIPAN
jgi:hypothetical protein